MKDNLQANYHLSGKFGDLMIADQITKLKFVSGYFFCTYRIVGIICGGKHSWILQLSLVRGKNFVVKSSLVTV